VVLQGKQDWKDQLTNIKPVSCPPRSADVKHWLTDKLKTFQDQMGQNNFPKFQLRYSEHYLVFLLTTMPSLFNTSVTM